ncbi:MAG TPA: hypothetical protein VGM51_07490 [Armatimonadota bacterium]|jgi:hypothetical protein
MAVIQLEVPASVAEWYREIGPADKANDGVDFLLWLEDRQKRREAGTQLGPIMDEIGRQAQERGLTPDLLEEILRNE